MSRFIQAVGGMKSSVIYTDVDSRSYRFSGGTWTWRNHNPGNIWSGTISKKHDQIGVTQKFAIFPDDESGRAALLDVLITTYGDMSIHDMIYEYAPPKENPTKKYEKLLREKTGVYDDTLIKNFTETQFDELWKAIEQMEGYKVGDIIEVFQITGVTKIDKNVYQYCLRDGNWVSETECINLAKRGMVELEVCVSHLGNTFLKVPTHSSFQEKLGSLM